MLWQFCFYNTEGKNSQWTWGEAPLLARVPEQKNGYERKQAKGASMAKGEKVIAGVEQRLRRAKNALQEGVSRGRSPRAVGSGQAH